MKRRRPGECELCARPVPLTFHHLIPRSLHKKRQIRERFDREARTGNGLWICRLCHRQIHRLFPRRLLAEQLNNREALLSEPELQRFLAWARRQR